MCDESDIIGGQRNGLYAVRCTSQSKVCAIVSKIRILRIICFPITPAQRRKPRTISRSSNTYKIIALATVSGGFQRSAPHGQPSAEGETVPTMVAVRRIDVSSV